MRVAFIVITAKGELQQRIKTFKTDTEMFRYLNRLEKKGTLYTVLGYSEN